MSFQPPNLKQENQNRKILEELQKKQQALKQQQQPTTTTNLAQTNNASIKSPLPSNQVKLQQNIGYNTNLIDFNYSATIQHSNGNQREKAALQHALQNSFGNFVTSDSSFGNVILPVLPTSN